MDLVSRYIYAVTKGFLSLFYKADLCLPYKILQTLLYDI